jgi:hypothetical protein
MQESLRERSKPLISNRIWKSRDVGERSWGGQEIWNQRKRLFSSRNPLKRLKTAKRIVGKAWRFQAKNLEMFGVDLENLARNLQRRTGVFPARRRQKA